MYIYILNSPELGYQTVSAVQCILKALFSQFLSSDPTPQVIEW